MKETKLITKNQNENYQKRNSAQKLTFAQLEEIIQRNVSKNVNKTYTQYTKDTVKSYLQSPATSLKYIVAISRFLERVSSLYKKILTYYAATPLFYYNLIQENDITKSLNGNKILKDYYTIAKQFNGFDIAKEMFNAIYMTARDGMYVGFMYGDEEHSFLMPLDIDFIRISGKNKAGQWIPYFDATFFKSGNNSIFVEGLDGSGSGVWDKVFVDGWNAYQADTTNARWFMLPPERTFVMIAGSDDQFDVPLPYLSSLFISLMDLVDLEAIIASKSELENYKLLVSKIPLINGSEDVDDFSLSLDLAEKFNEILEGALPDLVTAVTSPMEIDTIDFNKSNSTEDTDALSKSMQNFFNNAGVSQLVVAGGSSTNSVGLKHALANDLSNIWVWVNRIESWLNYYIKSNISEGYKIKIHEISWYNKEEYQNLMKESACLGASAMAYLTSLGNTPYIALQQLHFENAIGLKSLMIPLNSSFTQSGSNNGRPTKDDGDLSEDGLATRDNGKNEETKASK